MRIAIALSFWLFILGAFQADALAQGTSGGLQGLLQQLQKLDDQGALEGGGPGGGIGLDQSRVGGSDSPFDPVFGDSQRFRIIVPERKFSEGEQFLIQRFCRGKLTSSERALLDVVSEFSRLERDYCRRAGEVLLQFGYDSFAGEITPETLGTGAIQDTYVLGVGDELIITYRGQESRTENVRVDRLGRVVLAKLDPISAIGRTFGAFRRDLEARVRTAFIGTRVFLSLGSVRVVGVKVIGEVRQPGFHRLTGLSSVLDALAFAGGVKKTGSLRRIQVLRGDRIFWVDLYELLQANAGGSDLALFEGDTIVVPAIGPTVAIAGKVKLPAIFELPEGHETVAISDLIAFAGGTLRPRGNRLMRLGFDEAGQQEVVELGGERAAEIANGDLLIIGYSLDVQVGTVELTGHVRVPGRRSLVAAPTVRSLVQNLNQLKPDPYLLFAALETTDPATQARQMFPLNLRKIIAGEQDFSLRDNDKLVILGADEVRYLSSEDVQTIIQDLEGRQRLGPEPEGTGRTAEQTDSAATSSGTSSTGSLTKEIIDRIAGSGRPTEQGSDKQEGVAREEALREQEVTCRGLQSLATIIQVTQSGRFASAVSTESIGTRARFINPLGCPEVYDRFPRLLPFALEHVVSMNGEVRAPGGYPITAGTSLISVVAAAGGLTKDVNLRQLEVSRFAPQHQNGSASGRREFIDLASIQLASIAVSPGDVVRFNRVFTDRDTGPVQLSGEVLRPGLYDIRRGERLSELIARAGGLTAQAYPYGTVFTRERVRRAQQEGFKRAERELNSALLVAAANRGVDLGAVEQLSSLTEQLGSVQAVGRVVIEADPTVLQVRPELDAVLEPGDRVVVPKRPNSVLVIGDVLNPGALQFISGTTPDAYIRQAGGFQRSADEDRVFVVFPNGEAQPISVSVWNFTPVQIPPGSTIVVPKEPTPFDIFTFAKDVSQIVSQMAVTAASLAVISDN